MLAVLIYIAAISVANLSIATFGPWVSPINAFLLIGLDLALRDRLHDRWAGRMLWPRMLALIATAGGVSYAINPAAGRIALASLAAFTLAAAADAVAYHALRGRSFMTRSNGSNAAGAAVDSALFPLLAFGAFMPGVMLAQFAAKALGGAVWAWALNAIRPIATQPQDKQP